MKTLTLGLAALVLFASANASATIRTFTAFATGSQEVPPNGSTATGGCKAVTDDVALSVTFNGSFSGLSAAASEVHIHQGAVGVEGLVVFDATSGLVMAPSGQFVRSQTGMVPSDFSTIQSNLLAGTAYCNIHSQALTEGEIRGQFALTAGAPAMPKWAFFMFGLGLLGVGAALVARRARTA
jgi:hypothetical protein